MSFEDESLEEIREIIKKLRSVSSDLTPEEEEQAQLLVTYMKKLTENKDYEGKQTFPVEDYKRRN